MSLCDAHGDAVTIEREWPIIDQGDGKRHFLIVFKSVADAGYFATHTDQVTIGKEGVMINVN